MTIAENQGKAGGGMRLTEFLDLATLQDIQDSLAMVAQVKATILDTAGVPLTQTTVSERFSNRSAAIVAARKQKGDTNLDEPFSAPIIVNDVRLGSIVMEPAKSAPLKKFAGDAAGEEAGAGGGAGADGD